MFLAFYKVLVEPSIVNCSRRLDIYFGGGDFRARLFIDRRQVSFFFRVLNFRGWFRPRNYFNSDIFPIYGMWRQKSVTYTRNGNKKIETVVLIVSLM